MKKPEGLIVGSVKEIARHDPLLANISKLALGIIFFLGFPITEAYAEVICKDGSKFHVAKVYQVGETHDVATLEPGLPSNCGIAGRITLTGEPKQIVRPDGTKIWDHMLQATLAAEQGASIKVFDVIPLKPLKEGDKPRWNFQFGYWSELDDLVIPAVEQATIEVYTSLVYDDTSDRNLLSLVGGGTAGSGVRLELETVLGKTVIMKYDNLNPWLVDETLDLGPYDPSLAPTLKQFTIVKSTPVPAPLPILGFGPVILYVRKLRAKSRKVKSISISKLG
jgi:hypothetical protein